jgi:hypothetical protein
VSRRANRLHTLVTRRAGDSGTIGPMARPPFRLFTSTSSSVDDGQLPDAVRPRRQEGVLSQEAQGQTVLLRMDDGGYFALDEVGARIWELCDGERDLTDIVAVLCGEFDAPEELVMSDVVEFVDELRGEELLI